MGASNDRCTCDLPPAVGYIDAISAIEQANAIVPRKEMTLNISDQSRKVIGQSGVFSSLIVEEAGRSATDQGLGDDTGKSLPSPHKTHKKRTQ